MSDWINDRASRVPASASTAAQHETRPAAWSLVVPVKGGEGAKSRLRAPDGVDRIALARALALDTVAAGIEAIGADHVVRLIGATLRPLAWPVDALTLAPDNARAHADADVEAIAESLRLHQQQKPVVAKRSYRGLPNVVTIAVCSAGM